jgi:hypothetical protein
MGLTAKAAHAVAAIASPTENRNRIDKHTVNFLKHFRSALSSRSPVVLQGGERFMVES